MTKHNISLEVLIIVAVMLLVCTSEAVDPPRSCEVESAGIIRKQGITTYMYGTHVLLNDDKQTLCALKSDHINLDLYINKKVKVKGDLIKGYPVDRGPNYLNVKSIESF